MRIILTGAGGLLGSAFRDLLAPHMENVVLLGRDKLNVDDAGTIRSAIVDSRCDLLINCAAHTDLEAAERDPTRDRAVNGVLPGILADAARAVGAAMLHFSSTGCYGNWKTEPYNESDPLRPTTAHHRAKRDGEKAVIASGCRHLILRTGWLFGGAAGQPKNFVWNRLVEGLSRENMQSDAVQRGCPTYVGDVAREAFRLVSDGVEGVCNLTAQGTASRYEYVSAIIAAARLPCDVRPGPAFARLAPVSTNETSINARLQNMQLDGMPEWRSALHAYVATLISSDEWAPDDWSANVGMTKNRSSTR